MASSEESPRELRPRKRGILCSCCNYHGVCACCKSIHMTCWRVFKWFPVVLISAIICWSYYAYVVQLCIFTLDNAIERTVYLIIYHMLLVLLVWSYFRTIFTVIKIVPDKYKLPEAEVERLMRAESEDEQRHTLENFAKDLPVVTRTSSGAVRYCNRCVLVKPDRAHHCSICAKCVLKMDHHCPWINNCVCFFNYKFFVLFLGYALLYCLFIAMTSLPYFIKFWKGEFGNAASAGRYHIVFAFFVSIMFAVSLGSLFFYHCYLVANNRTTLESFRAPMFRGGEDKNGFSMGYFRNFKEVFGNKPNLWFFPIFSSLGNGCDFPVRGEHEYHGFTAPLEPHGYESMGTTRSSFGDGIEFPQPAKGEDTESLLSSERWDRWGERARPFDDRDTSSYDDIFD